MNTSNPPAVSASNLLRELHSKARDALSFTPEERRAVVEHLTLEGYSTTELAALLKVSDRTIQRDRHHIRAENAVFADDAGFTPRLVGDYLRQTEVCLARIRRAVRNSDVSARDRIYAEKACHDILSKTLKVLQSIGYVQHVKPNATNGLTEPPPPRLDPPPHEPMSESFLVDLCGRKKAERMMALQMPEPHTPKQEWRKRYGQGIGMHDPQSRQARRKLARTLRKTRREQQRLEAEEEQRRLRRQRHKQAATSDPPPAPGGRPPPEPAGLLRADLDERHADGTSGPHDGSTQEALREVVTLPAVG